MTRYLSRFALDWNIDERRLVVLFANATCNLLVESLEKFEIESIKDIKSKKPIEIKKVDSSLCADQVLFEIFIVLAASLQIFVYLLRTSERKAV